MFGVWPLRILEVLHPMHPSVAPSSVHREGDLPDGSEPLLAEVLATCHRAHNARKGDELLLLAAQERLSLEEGNDFRQEIASLANDEHQRRVRRAAMIRLDPATTEPEPDQVEHLSALGILTHVELRDELPAQPRRGVPLYGDVEGPFSIDIARNVGIQPFLLIDRTQRVVTVHVATLAVANDMVSSIGMHGVSSI
jgi:hypothetical protein